MIHPARALQGATLLLGLLAAACAPGDPQPPRAEREASAGLPPGHPAIGWIGGPGTAVTGVIMETMDGGGYTFVLLDLGDREIWVAGPETALKSGDVTALPDTMNMGEFEVKSLQRTFDVLYFTSEFGTREPPEIAATEFQGQVKETMNSAGYTYVLVEADGNTIWLAAPETTVAVGQTVVWNGGMVMKQFHSPSLDRTFETIYFVDAVSVAPPDA
jgi:hypothetical protein